MGVPGSAARTAAMTGTHAIAFRIDVDRGVAGPRGFAADVEQVGALVDHAPGLGDGAGHRSIGRSGVPVRPAPGARRRRTNPA